MPCGPSLQVEIHNLDFKYIIEHINYNNFVKEILHLFFWGGGQKILILTLIKTLSLPIILGIHVPVASEAN